MGLEDALKACGVYKKIPSLFLVAGSLLEHSLGRHLFQFSFQTFVANATAVVNYSTISRLAWSNFSLCKITSSFFVFFTFDHS